MRRKLRVKRLEIIISSKFYLDENQNWSWVFCVTMAFHARIVFILTCKTCWAPRAPRKGVSSRGGGGGGGGGYNGNMQKRQRQKQINDYREELPQTIRQILG